MDVETGLLVATVILAVATGWLAFATHKLAVSTRGILEVETLPYLAFDGLEIGTRAEEAGKTGIQVGLKLRNPSRVPLSYVVKDMLCTCDGKTLDRPTLENKSGILGPTEVRTFNYGTILNIDVLPLEKTGHVKFKIEYGMLESAPKFVFESEINYSASLATKLASWSFVSERRVAL